MASHGVAACMLTIESSLLAQESYLAVWIAADRAYDDSFLFATLEAIDRSEFYPGICFFKHSCQQCQLYRRNISPIHDKETPISCRKFVR